MTLKEMIAAGLLDELARLVDNETNATILLEALGYTAARPQFGTEPLTFWTAICTNIDRGRVPGGQDLQPLVDAVARRYSSNGLFTQYCSQENIVAPQQPSSSQQFVSLLVQGWVGVTGLLAAVRAQAQQMGFAASTVEPGFANAEGILLNLANWAPEQAMQLAEALRRQREGVQTAVSTTPYLDYLLRLIIIGPDQAQFQIPDIRASTRIRDILQNVMGAFYSGGARRGPQTRTIAVADLEDKDGKQRRLRPDKTLHEEGVKDGDTVHVGQEGRAGAIDPAFREQALARAYRQVMRFAADNPGFAVSTNSDRVPTEYLFEFSIPSFAPPPAKGEAPLEIDDHQVFLALLAEFPMKAPQAFWRTPIYHPNIHRKSGKVCLGILNDAYKPSMDFGLLCEMLVNIAGYRNYAVNEAYDAEALDWARTPVGQAAIERRGGQSVVRDFLDQFYTPRPMHIRRIE